MSTASHGQSLETTIAQVVADELGVDIAQVRVVQGRHRLRRRSAPGPAAAAARSIPGTAARLAAQEIRSRIVAIVAHKLEASPDDLEIVDGRVQVRGTPTEGMTIAEVAAKVAHASPARMPPGVPLGLEAQVRYTPENVLHVVERVPHVRSSRSTADTGAVEILRYVVSEDCGVMINPNVVEGQIAGGVVQGIGGVLYEHLAYDDAGNPLATTFVDYLLPTATEVPEIEYAPHRDARADEPRWPQGPRARAARSAAPPCVINAIADALAPLGAKVRHQPLGPAHIVALIETASPTS